MDESEDNEQHVQSSLGLYLAGAVSSDEQARIEEHLTNCEVCLGEADELSQVVAALALLTETDRRELVAEFGTQNSRDALADAAGSPSSSAPGVGSSSPSPRPSNASGPRQQPTAQTGPGRGARSPRRSRPRSLLVIAGVVTLLVLSIGALSWSTLDEPQRPPNGVTLVADAADRSTGASLSVVVTDDGQDDRATVRATVAGLRPGHRYRLYATDRDGQIWELAVLTGRDGTQDVEASCPVPLDALARFSVTGDDGALAVQADVNDPASPSPSASR
ncbi:zf-HC2 domain-containing protein [Micromonospora sp. NPDC003197]